ncbi:MAG: hypothetical protein KKF48_04700 [Nanoarchaeota archaeon]|nr:hypothetical protein [Nanoarchaeota archaeon]MBU1028316.1 hypothetical protein [Nanoarchaeota archaeon]
MINITIPNSLEHKRVVEGERIIYEDNNSLVSLKRTDSRKITEWSYMKEKTGWLQKGIILKPLIGYDFYPIDGEEYNKRNKLLEEVRL